MKFECHLTFDKIRAEVVKAQACDGWKFSEISGDPIMGERPYAYLTAYDDNFPDMFRRMEEKVQYFSNYGIICLREKIELIVYDTKTKVGISNVRPA